MEIPIELNSLCHWLRHNNKNKQKALKNKQDNYVNNTMLIALL